MEIYYTNQAKNDLTKINWKSRAKIILALRDACQKKSLQGIGFRKMHNSEFVRMDLEELTIIGSETDSKLHIVTIQQKRATKMPFTKS